MVPVLNRYQYREFFIFSAGIGTGIEKIWYRKKVSEPVSEKFGTGKSICIGIVQNFGYLHPLVPTSLDVLAVAALLTACSVLQQLAAHLYLLSLLQLMHSTDLACTALNSTVLYRCALQIVWYNALNCSCCTVSSYLVRGRDPLSIKDCGCQQGCISKIIIVLSLSFSSISSSSSF